MNKGCSTETPLPSTLPKTASLSLGGMSGGNGTWDPDELAVTFTIKSPEDPADALTVGSPATKRSPDKMKMDMYMHFTLSHVRCRGATDHLKVLKILLIHLADGANWNLKVQTCKMRKPHMKSAKLTSWMLATNMNLECTTCCKMLSEIMNPRLKQRKLQTAAGHCSNRYGLYFNIFGSSDGSNATEPRILSIFRSLKSLRKPIANFSANFLG